MIEASSRARSSIASVTGIVEVSVEITVEQLLFFFELLETLGFTLVEVVLELSPLDLA